MTLASMNKEPLTVDLDQMKFLMRRQRKILEMLHPARRVQTTGDPTTVTLDEPHKQEQQHQERHDNDDLIH